jgi:hypothetical protein
LNVMAPGVEQLFNDGRKASVMFTDPPWGDGAVKNFARLAQKDTGRTFEAVPYDALLARIAHLVARFVTDHVFIETGVRWEAQNLEMMHRIGLRNLERVELLYDSGGKQHPSVLLHGSFLGQSARINDFYHWKGLKVAHMAVNRVRQPGEIVFDPCCGMGYSAQAALDNGMEFRGNELNPVRAQKTIERLLRSL